LFPFLFSCLVHSTNGHLMDFFKWQTKIHFSFKFCREHYVANKLLSKD
jgi:hypothetical protein